MLSSSVILSDSSRSVEFSGGTAAADEFESMKPKSSVFDVGVVACGVLGVVVLPLLPISMKPSRFVGTTTSCLGSLTTPRFWSSRTSIILFFFLNIIIIEVLRFI